MVDKVAAQVKAMMDGPLTINQKVNQVIDLLEAHGLAHKVVLRPSQILCHPDNRGGTMVSYHDAWSKGMAMLAVGIQTNLLQGSMAIEMSKDEAKRKVQISKNEQLIQEGIGHPGSHAATSGGASLARDHEPPASPRASMSARPPRQGPRPSELPWGPPC